MQLLRSRAGRRQHRLATLALCVGQLMIVLDVTVVNVALPAIQRSLHFSQADLAWVVNAYLISFAGFLLLAGRAGDLIGRKKVFLAGLAVFTVASLACGLAQSQAMLIAARFVQGVGGAIGTSVILGILVAEVTTVRERARMVGLYTLSARPEPRSGCCSGASSRRLSAGIGSSSSTSRSERWRSSSVRSPSARTTAPGYARGSTRSARS
jgi:MFS family permease